MAFYLSMLPGNKRQGVAIRTRAGRDSLHFVESCICNIRSQYVRGREWLHSRGLPSLSLNVVATRTRAGMASAAFRGVNTASSFVATRTRAGRASIRSGERHVPPAQAHGRPGPRGPRGQGLRDPVHAGGDFRYGNVSEIYFNGKVKKMAAEVRSNTRPPANKEIEVTWSPRSRTVTFSRPRSNSCTE
jgi:hypothetical protein